MNGAAREVWTGSANFSENAFNFQTNAALIIRDPKTAHFYENYYQALTSNPSKADSKVANLEIMEQANTVDNRFAEKTFFSPISKKEIITTAVDLIHAAQSIVMISAPFGVDNKMIEALLSNNADVMEYGLVNTTAKKKIDKLWRRNTRFFPPNRLVTYLGQSWDAQAFGAHKIHAKTMVVDPWSDNPQVLIGSANFSEASCSDNDENALLISGNKRLSAIIATEFMRMYDHYKSRFYLQPIIKANLKIERENRQRKKQGLEPKPLITITNHLQADERWSKTAFDPKAFSHKYRDRIVFSGG